MGRAGWSLLLWPVAWAVAATAVLAADAEVPGEAATQPLTLQACVARALKRSETVAIQQELIAETEARFLQALSGILPRASYSLSEKRQDGNNASSSTLKRVPERKFVFSQPLFSGFKEFAAMAGSRAEQRERRQEKARAEHLLFLDVADAFHLLLEEREDLAALEAIRAALQERIGELAERQRLGRSRASEVASATVQLRRTEAELERARRKETVSRQLLEFLTGQTPIGALAADALPAIPRASEDEHLAKTDLRPDVRAAESAWELARKQVTVAQAAYWPTVNLDGNYYTKRTGASQDVDWDATLTVELPLFQGGQAAGAVREASSKARQAQLLAQQVRREAEREIREACVALRASARETDALERALEAAEENHRLQVEDYHRNLVNNLDVLQALQALEDSRRDAIHARHDTARLYWQLRAATADLPLE